MKKDFEDKFLDYIDGTLPEEEKLALEKALHSDAELKKSFQDYKKVISTERIINMQKHELNANFSVKVMDRIENERQGFLKRLFMDMSLNKRSAAGVFATLAVLIFVVQFYRMRPNDMLRTDIPASAPQASVTSPVLAKPLPPEEGKERTNVQPVNPETINKYIENSTKNPPQGLLEEDRVTEFKKNVTRQSQQENPKSFESRTAEIYKRVEEKMAEKEVANAPAFQVDKDALQQYSEQLKKGQPLPKTLERKEIASAEIEAADESSLSLGKSDGISRDLAPGKSKGLYDETMRQAVPKVAAGAIAPPPSRRNADMIVQQTYDDAESYTGYEENPRIEVRKEPSSTFGIDVDTASYTNTRRFLQEGRLPAKDSVRIEEFLNYFDYKYPQQYDKPFSLSYEIAPSPLEKDRYLLKLGIKARDKKETSKPWNLVFLVDVSGSMMDTNKLPLVQRSLRLLTENMKDGDKVAIVTYAGNAGTVLESTTIKEKSKILSAIDSLSAGGSTNGSGGITAAYDVALKNKIDGAVNRVVLATDGDFNVGVTSQDELIKLIEEKRKSGITLTTLGFGTGNIKDGTMEQLANKGNGNYYYIDSFKEARKVLETDLAGTMEVVAKDVKLQIEFNPEHVQSYRLIGYENRKLKREDFNNDAIDAGEIGTGHTVTALYEIVLTNSPLAQKMNEEYRYQDKEETKKEVKDASHTGELAFLKIRYKEPEGSESTLLSFPIDKANLKDNVDNESIDFKFAAAVSYFAHILRESSFKGSYTYKDIITLAESAKGEDKNGYRQEFIELVKDAASIR
jgi:Ca-activated chloride channel family protein